MKKEVKKKHFSWKWFAVFVILSILAWGTWWLFFSYAKCDSWNCFNEYLEDCKRVKFIGERELVFEYIVKGESDLGCKVNVQLLKGEVDNQKSIKLEMQKMTCILPKGVVMIPESDIGNCHGMLKEGLQDLMIEKLHTYLVQNIGKINLEVLDAPVE